MPLLLNSTGPLLAGRRLETYFHAIVSGPDVMQETPSILTPEEEEKSMKRKCEPFNLSRGVIQAQH
jgi:hypothetical protein